MSSSSKLSLFTDSRYGDDVEACAPVSPGTVLYELRKVVRTRPPPGATDAEVIQVLRWEGARLGMVSSRALTWAFIEKARVDEENKTDDERKDEEAAREAARKEWEADREEEEDAIQYALIQHIRGVNREAPKKRRKRCFVTRRNTL